MVFSDNIIRELDRKRPKTIEELWMIDGITHESIAANEIRFSNVRLNFFCILITCPY